jgi:CubicO group peptidase (beta-lactamase class C family)
MHGMAKPSLLTTENGLPSSVQGACDSRFSKVVRAFAGLYPGRKFGGGALSVYIDGRQVVDVWTGYADRRGEQVWTADTGAMVFSATKGLSATIIHRLADRGLLSYDAPVAEYWPEFGANGKSEITLSDVLRHRAGLSHLKGVGKTDVLDHLQMEARLADAPLDHTRGKTAYHAITYGWLLSGLARAVTGKGMRELFREELAEPLHTDGLHLGRPPADAPTKAAQTLVPQAKLPTPLLDFIAPKVAGLSFSGLLGSIYFPGILSMLQGDMPFLDGEVPAVNGVVTARALAKTYAALSHDGEVDGTRLLSREAVQGLAGKAELWPDLNLGIPFTYHQGYQSSPVPGFLEGYGHIGLGGTVGWADPESGSSFGYVHNRLLTLLLFDVGSFAGLAPLLTSAVAAARADDPQEVPALGAPYHESGQPEAVAEDAS